MSNQGNSGLWNSGVDPQKYEANGKYQDHVLEQYKLYVDMADKTSTRRDLANTFFLTFHTLSIGAAGFIYEKGPKVANPWVLLFPLCVLLIQCYFWWRIVKSYRQLNTAKYKVVGELEQRLPASPYWVAEWKQLGEGKNPDLYVPLTNVEGKIPLFFAILYVVATVYIMFQ